MVDRIQKILRTASRKEQGALISIIKKIIDDDLVSLEVKKLQGAESVYRVRKGNFRIVFRKIASGNNHIITIERRSDTTYHHDW